MDDVIEYLRDCGFTPLGYDQDMVFYRLPNGVVQGASEEAVAREMLKNKEETNHEKAN